MSENEYLACDAEVFAMVNNSRSNRPVAVLVPMERIQQMEDFHRRTRQTKRAASVVAPLTVGLLAVGAMARGLMAPGLTIAVLGSSIVYAAVKFWSGGDG